MVKPLDYYKQQPGLVDQHFGGHEGERHPERWCSVLPAPSMVNPKSLPVTESAPIQQAWSPYGNTKQMCEDILRFATMTLPLKAIALRYFNPIGAHESALIGELPLGVPGNLVPFITQTAIGIRECLSVFGDDYDTPRRLCHTRLHPRSGLGQSPCHRRGTHAGRKRQVQFGNLQLGHGQRLVPFWKSSTPSKKCQRCQKLNYKIVPRRPGDIEKTWADTTFANDELGWKAEKDLDEMMLSAWNWEKALAAKK